MNVDSVAELLKPLPFKSVSGLDELAKIAERPNIALPAAYVIADSEVGTPPIEGSYILDQVLTCAVAIVIVVRPDGARRGAAADSLAELGDMVLTVLYGTQPAGWDSVLTVADIRTVDITAGLTSRVIRMRGRTRIRKTLQPS